MTAPLKPGDVADPEKLARWRVHFHLYAAQGKLWPTWRDVEALDEQAAIEAAKATEKREANAEGKRHLGYFASHVRVEPAPPLRVTCPKCDGKHPSTGDGSGWDGANYHDPGCDFCQGEGVVPKTAADSYRAGLNTTGRPS